MLFSTKVLLASTALFVSIPTKPDLPPLPKLEFGKLPEFFPLGEQGEVAIDLEIAGRNSKISMTFLVEKKEDKYLYTYTVCNESKYLIGFRFSVFDNITGAEVMLLILDSGKSRKITLESDKIPVYGQGAAQVWLLVKPDDEAWKKDMKKAGATIDGDFFHPVTGKITGPVPAGFK